MEEADALEGLGQRRIDMGLALARLEGALSRPIGSPDEWTARVDLALDDLLIVGRIEVSALLAEGGPLDDAVRFAPRLSGQVARLRQHLPEMEREAEALQKRLGDLDPKDVRRHLLRLLGRVVGYRHLLADIIWEAYNVDLGGTG